MGTEGGRPWRQSSSHVRPLSPSLSPLNHYDADTTLPRPESFREDEQLARSAHRARGILFRELAAGGGWGVWGWGVGDVLERSCECVFECNDPR